MQQQMGFPILSMQRRFMNSGPEKMHRHWSWKSGCWIIQLWNRFRLLSSVAMPRQNSTCQEFMEKIRLIFSPLCSDSSKRSAGYCDGESFISEKTLTIYSGDGAIVVSASCLLLLLRRTFLKNFNFFLGLRATLVILPSGSQGHLGFSATQCRHDCQMAIFYTMQYNANFAIAL